MKLTLHILAGLFILMATSPSVASEEATPEISESNLIVTVKRSPTQDNLRSAFDHLEARPVQNTIETEAPAQSVISEANTAASAITIHVSHKKMGESTLVSEPAR